MIAELDQELKDLISATIGPQLRQVATLPQIDSRTVLQKLMTSAPAVYTNLRAFPIKNHKAEIGFDVICLARNARGHDAALQGDAATIGLYEMIEQLLNRFDAATGWTVSNVSRPRDSAFMENGLYAATVTVSRPIALPFVIDLNTLDDFVLLHQEHDIDKAQTDEPSAIDNVQLPQ